MIVYRRFQDKRGDSTTITERDAKGNILHDSVMGLDRRLCVLQFLEQIGSNANILAITEGPEVVIVWYEK